MDFLVRSALVSLAGRVSATGFCCPRYGRSGTACGSARHHGGGGVGAAGGGGFQVIFWGFCKNRREFFPLLKSCNFPTFAMLPRALRRRPRQNHLFSEIG